MGTIHNHSTQSRNLDIMTNKNWTCIKMSSNSARDGQVSDVDSTSSTCSFSISVDSISLRSSANSDNTSTIVNGCKLVCSKVFVDVN